MLFLTYYTTHRELLSEKWKEIPSNDKDFFIINPGKLKWTLDILFSDQVNINIFNLFMILKSYINEESFYFTNVYLIIATKSDYSYNYKRVDDYFIRTKNYYEFKFFFINILYSDREYLKEYKYVGFTLFFNKNSKIFKKGILYPIYPWKKEHVDFYLDYRNDYTVKAKNKTLYLPDYNELNDLKNEINALKNENEKLKLEIYNIKNKKDDK